MKNTFHAFTLAALFTLSFTAQALCINPDGSLDDSSMESALIDKGLLPECAARKVPDSTVQKPTTEDSKQRSKGPDKQSQYETDCRTSSGESTMGYVGSVELLPACKG